MKNNKLFLVLGVIALIVILGIMAFLLLKNNTLTNQNNTATITPSQGTSNNQPVSKEVQKILTETQTVLLTPSGFKPKNVTIKSGGRVVWTNQSGTQGTVNSDVYPTNLLWPFLNLGSFDDGSSVSVVFEKAGTYTYHNHLKPSETGTVIVK